MPLAPVPLLEALSRWWRRWGVVLTQAAAGVAAGLCTAVQAPITGLAVAAVLLLALSLRPRRPGPELLRADTEDTLGDPDCETAAAELWELLEATERDAQGQA